MQRVASMLRCPSAEGNRASVGQASMQRVHVPQRSAAGMLTLDPGEDGERQLAVPEHILVELPDVEGSALPTFPLAAQPLDLAPAS